MIGRRHVLTGQVAKAGFLTGYRSGGGEAVAVIRPGSLVELWRVFEACVAAGHIVIAQAANTGLTGGPTPLGRYDRPLVVVNTLRIRGVIPIRGGRQAVCLAGSTLNELERTLAPLGREPHSVIGSSCLGASVVGGVCNNSGGALVRRGPSYTEYALFARVEADGTARLHNHLGIRFSGDSEAMLQALDAGRITSEAVTCDGRAASAAADYEAIVRACNEATPARFNADPRRLHDASGSAGKILVLAVRLDTFAAPDKTATFYVGTNDPAELTALRRRFLTAPVPLPVSAEYVHRSASELAGRYGKDLVLAVRWMGTGRLPGLFRAKAWLDRIAGRLPFVPAPLCDRVLQRASQALPAHLPRRLTRFQGTYDHHLILTLADDGIALGRRLLDEAFPSASGAVLACNAREAEAALLHRFSVAGAAVRVRALRPDTIEGLVAIDVALRRNDAQWFERLPPEIDAQLIAKIYYGHFFCHVFHQDYLVKKGVDPEALEQRILETLDRRGAEYPAEHNVGHCYPAKPALAEHYRQLDPLNRMNPGIGKTSRQDAYL